MEYPIHNIFMSYMYNPRSAMEHFRISAGYYDEPRNQRRYSVVQGIQPYRRASTRHKSAYVPVAYDAPDLFFMRPSPKSSVRRNILVPTPARIALRNDLSRENDAFREMFYPDLRRAKSEAARQLRFDPMNM